MIEQKNEMKAVKTLLKLFTKKYSKQEYLDIVVKCIQDWCGCRCVGIRFLTEEGYIPYESYVGFSEEFWESENWLSVNSDKCACIRVIAGNQEPQDAPVMTQGGSFFSNNAIKYFSELSEEQRARFRGVCVQSGYASIAIVPIMHKGKTIGAIYLADEHKGKVPVQVVEFIESITPLIGEAINTCDLKEELQVSCDIQLVLDNLLDGISEIVYVADPKTYEILYVNQTTRNLFQKDPVGGTCYREFQGRESPCEFCTNEIILKEKGKPYQWEYHNPLLNKDFMLVDKVIKWTDGRDVRFEFAVDITGLKTAEKAVRSRLEFEKTVKRISSRFVGVYDLDDAINASLADMGKLSRASRAYLFCFRQDGAKMDNTHEWCAESVSPQIGNLQNLSSDTVPWWMAKLSRGEVIHIQDVSEMPPEANAEKEILESQDIKSLLVLPLYVKGELYGFIGFDNIRETGMWSNDALTLLRLFSEIIGNAFDRQRVEEALRKSEDSYRTIFENTGTATVIIEKDTVISLVNAEFERLSGYSKEEVEGKKSWTEFVAKENLEKMKESHYLPRSNPQATPRCYEGQFMDRQGNIKDVIVTVAMLPGTKKSVASLLDITERKRAEERLEYLSFHDPLTGLYNRTYFEKEMSRFENRPDSAVSIIICDVDGLKLVNDTLGHDAGDSLLVAAANVLKESFRPGIVIARVGGDEFAILLPNNNKTSVEDACSRIRDSVARYNVANPKLALNTSIGFAIRTDPSRSMDELFKEADNAMYREKLHHNESSRSAIVQTLKKALEARDFITDGHAERLKDLVINLARAFGLPERKMADLRLLAQFHDIGKVGIPDSILFKPGPLTPEETSEMHRHCEIGYRIAQSSPDLLPIADWILKHHEWWNGQGYPLGLKGEEIPLECRILAVADAYEAMTSDRPYRRAMSHDEAVAELKRYAGTQFDPQIVDKFLEVQKAIIKSLVLHNHGMLLSSCKQMRY